ncbi:DUF1656 domain-containing protein [Microvirga puerhi]|uniref:DUF1656 domain-containing protein n=1 Tax=Microvirga puerhi TaxID=2876078 RepID=A0ABS7VRD5_9HYPH|nr:DUF1656 domain-containing protein [Microvirga puerhi]MBZ6078111.1 DUF1656 domain-containing protein [Microvirga puerhi]
MIKEIDLFGIFLPPLFAYAGLAALLWLVLRALLRWVGAYRLIWHPALFNTALYVLILSGCIFAVFHWDL